MSPRTITGQPRFSYRGLLIDTCCHYLPLPIIKNVIDSMTYAKLICNIILTNIALPRDMKLLTMRRHSTTFDNKLNRKTVVHKWLNGGVAEQVVASGLRCIVSS
ncbi:hypothetical protein SLA2020_051070 [Shorea laevis]